MTARKTFHLNRREGKFMGVCAGIADYIGIDATIVRIAAVVLTIAGGFPWTLIAYGGVVYIAQRQTRKRAIRDDLVGLRDYEPRGSSLRDPAPRGSSLQSPARDLDETMRDIDRRLADVDRYVTSSNAQLAKEIDELR